MGGAQIEGGIIDLARHGSHLPPRGQISQDNHRDEVLVSDKDASNDHAPSQHVNLSKIFKIFTLYRNLK